MECESIQATGELFRLLPESPIAMAQAATIMILTTRTGVDKWVRRTSNGGYMFSNVTTVCELRYEPGKGLFERRGDAKRETSSEEVERLYTAEAFSMLRKYPSTWCAIVTPGAASKGKPPTEGEQIEELLRLIKSTLTEGPRWQKELRPALLIETLAADSRWASGCTEEIELTGRFRGEHL